MSLYHGIANAIKDSVVQGSMGMGLGLVIESIMPTPTADSDLFQIALETAAQFGLNAMMLELLSRQQGQGDTPHYMTIYALVESQPNLRYRLSVLSDSLRSTMDSQLPRRGPLTVD